MDYGCKHYTRKCKLVAPCCNLEFSCRFCHDDASNHEIDRKSVQQVSCSVCQLVQDVAEVCTQCGVVFAEYFCSVCRLYDCDKRQFHCEPCGLCRVGGRDNFFHCSKCGLCLANDTRESHKCIEKSSHNNCPVCMDDIHTSRIPAHMPKCGHLIHETCYKSMLSAGHYACPICGQSALKMDDAWKQLDALVEATPMPADYQNVTVGILCKDCHKESTVKFHILDLKCLECGSYNTSRVKGPFNLPESAQTGEELEISEDSDSDSYETIGEVETIEDVDDVGASDGVETVTSNDVTTSNQSDATPAQDNTAGSDATASSDMNIDLD